jgi:hypothetical protein
VTQEEYIERRTLRIPREQVPFAQEVVKRQVAMGWEVEQQGTYNYPQDLFVIHLTRRGQGRKTLPAPVRRRRIWPWFLGTAIIGIAVIFGLGVAAFTVSGEVGSGPLLAMLIVGFVILMRLSFRTKRKCGGLHCSGCRDH